MSFFDRFRARTVARLQLVEDRGNSFYAWDGDIYRSDIVRSAIRPKVKAVGKLLARHLRETVNREGGRVLSVNPEPFMRFLLSDPNPYMSGQMLQEKLATQLCLNNNAFALIVRDGNGLPAEIYPLTALSAEALYTAAGELLLRFYFRNGRQFTFRYSDVIHLRQDFGDNDIFGDSAAAALKPLMEIISTADQGIVKAIRNGGVIRWLLKFTNSMRPEDVDKETQRFAKNYLSIENGAGVAGVDSKADAQQVKPESYVPNVAQLNAARERIYAIFNTNEKIVNSSRTEDEWNAYCDPEVEPVLLQLQNEYTRKLFSRKERGCGNRIVFEASCWDSASISTKLNLLRMVDRGALTPNEWRAAFNLAPVPGGDEPIRRLDTRPTTEGSNA